MAATVIPVNVVGINGVPKTSFPLKLSAEGIKVIDNVDGVSGALCTVISPNTPSGGGFTNYQVAETSAVVMALANADSETTEIVTNHTPVAINATATATAAQVASGYITSTSAAPTTITLPTGTLLGAAIGAVQGTILDLYIDNTAGASTVTVAVAVNGILSAAAAANGASQGLLTVPSGVTGQACFRLMFSSATAYTFTRVA